MPRVKRKASVRVVAGPVPRADGGRSWALLIRTLRDREPRLYVVESAPCEWGQGFLVRHFGRADAYEVCLPTDGSSPTCTCVGALKWGRVCKHVKALLALGRVGRL